MSRRVTIEALAEWLKAQDDVVLLGHVSPDGRKVVSLAFRKGDLDPWEHLSNMQVKLYLMDADGGNRRLLLDFFGGQGSINVNSWAPDSRRFAFVRYILHHS